MVSSASSSAGPSTTCLLQPASSSQGSADALSPLAGSLPVSDHKFSQPLPPPAPPTPLPPPLPQQQSCQHQPPHQFHHQQQQQRHRPMSLASLVSSVEPNVTPSASRPPAQLEHRPPIHLGDSRPLGPPAGASALPNGRAEYENSPPAMAKTINSNDNNQLPHIAEALGFNSQQPQLPLQDHHAFVQSSSGAPERQVILGSRSHHDAVRDDDPFPPVDCDANVSSARRPSIRDALHPYSHSAPVALKIGPPLVHPLQNSRRSNSPISRNWTRSRCAEADDSPPPAADPLWEPPAYLRKSHYSRPNSSSLRPVFHLERTEWPPAEIAIRKHQTERPVFHLYRDISPPETGTFRLESPPEMYRTFIPDRRAAGPNRSVLEDARPRGCPPNCYDLQPLHDISPLPRMIPSPELRSLSQSASRLTVDAGHGDPRSRADALMSAAAAAAAAAVANMTGTVVGGKGDDSPSGQVAAIAAMAAAAAAAAIVGRVIPLPSSPSMGPLAINPSPKALNMPEQGLFPQNSSRSRSSNPSRTVGPPASFKSGRPRDHSRSPPAVMEGGKQSSLGLESTIASARCGAGHDYSSGVISSKKIKQNRLVPVEMPLNPREQSALVASGTPSLPLPSSASAPFLSTTSPQGNTPTLIGPSPEKFMASRAATVNQLRKSKGGGRLLTPLNLSAPAAVATGKSPTSSRLSGDLPAQPQPSPATVAHDLHPSFPLFSSSSISTPSATMSAMASGAAPAWDGSNLKSPLMSDLNGFENRKSSNSPVLDDTRMDVKMDEQRSARSSDSGQDQPDDDASMDGEQVGGSSESNNNVEGSRSISSGSPDKKYQCQYCSKRFSRPSSLTTHSYTHTGERPHVCTMPGCGRSFSVLSNLRRHLRICQRNLVRRCEMGNNSNSVSSSPAGTNESQAIRSSKQGALSKKADAGVRSKPPPAVVCDGGLPPAPISEPNAGNSSADGLGVFPLHDMPSGSNGDGPTPFSRNAEDSPADSSTPSASSGSSGSNQSSSSPKSSPSANITTLETGSESDLASRDCALDPLRLLSFAATDSLDGKSLRREFHAEGFRPSRVNSAHHPIFLQKPVTIEDGMLRAESSAQGNKTDFPATLSPTLHSKSGEPRHPYQIPLHESHPLHPSTSSLTLAAVTPPDSAESDNSRSSQNESTRHSHRSNNLSSQHRSHHHGNSHSSHPYGGNSLDGSGRESRGTSGRTAGSAGRASPAVSNGSLMGRTAGGPIKRTRQSSVDGEHNYPQQQQRLYSQYPQRHQFSHSAGGGGGGTAEIEWNERKTTSPTSRTDLQYQPAHSHRRKGSLSTSPAVGGYDGVGEEAVALGLQPAATRGECRGQKRRRDEADEDSQHLNV